MNVKNIGLLSESEKIEIIYLQGEKINLLEEKIKQLENRLDKHSKKHSKNSHKPPSSDQSKKKTKSLRKKSDKKVGGQPGHKAHNLKFSKKPDEIHRHTIVQCECCGEPLKKKADKIAKRQVFEIPKPKFTVIEHQGEIKQCNNCGHINKAEFPEGVTRSTQYGARAKSIMVYLSQYQLLPYKRLKLLFQTLYDHTLSSGTIYNAVNESAERLQSIDQKIAKVLIKSYVLHSDETGMNVNKDRHWLHVASSEQATHYGVHKARGSEAMDAIGILTNYYGILIHDHWKSYFKYPAKMHGLCNAHHLRELQYINEVQGLRWAKEMSELLLDIYNRKELAINKGRCRFNKKTKRFFINKYESIILQGKREQAVRGTNDSKNLLNRLATRRQETLLFMEDFRVPFTNNQGEQDLRMMKVQQKITGGFRTMDGAKSFCVNCGVISTIIKNGKNILNALEKSFLSKLTMRHVLAT